MKKLLVALLFVATTLTMMAIPAKPGLWRTIKLADGTEVRVQLVGDEHAHWMQAADGTCYVQDNGIYVKTTLETMEAKRAARLESRKASRRAIYASTSDGLGKKGTMSRGSVPSIGSYTIPVVMVQFSDTKFQSTTTVEKMKRYYNAEGYHEESGCVGSVRDYFKAQSGGQFVPTFDVVGIVTLSNKASYYGKNTPSDDYYLDKLPGDVIAAAKSQLNVDFSKYVVPAGDSYHSAGVPLMAMLYAGEGEATYGEEDTIWPCEWDDVEDGSQGNYDNVHFNSFFVGNELLTLINDWEVKIGTTLMGMSVFCHEFSHALGLPDFYVTDGSYKNDDPFGFWSIMDSGSYVDNECRTPVGYNAYEKSCMGWLELKEFGDATEVTLQSPQGLAENSAYIIRNSSNETFIFENRQPGTWYPSDFGSGVLVSRICYSYNDWNTNKLNNTKSKKRACVLTADGAKMYYSADKNNLYGYSKTSIGTLKTWSGSTIDAKIKTVTKNADGTITLTLGESGTGGGDDPVVTPTGDYLFYESFNKCAGTGGNDGKWSGAGVAQSTIMTDNTGWTYGSGKGYGANQCVRFGGSDTAGSATTPTIALNGTATLTFKAGAWDSSRDGTMLSLTATGGTVTPASFTLTKGDFQNYTATVTGTGSVKLTFKTSSRRFFLDEVLVVDNNASGIQTVTVSRPANQKIYTLDGRYVGTDFDVLPHGLYIVGGRKVVK